MCQVYMQKSGVVDRLCWLSGGRGYPWGLITLVFSILVQCSFIIWSEWCSVVLFKESCILNDETMDFLPVSGKWAKQRSSVNPPSRAAVQGLAEQTETTWVIHWKVDPEARTEIKAVWSKTHFILERKFYLFLYFLCLSCPWFSSSHLSHLLSH